MSIGFLSVENLLILLNKLGELKMLNSVIMILGGLMAAMSLVVLMVPKSKDTFEKLVPLQGFVGIGLMFWALWGLVQLLRYGVFDILAMVLIVLQILVGFLLAFSLLSKYIFKSQEALEKGKKLRSKMAAFQGPMGLVLAGFGTWYLLRNFI